MKRVLALALLWMLTGPALASPARNFTIGGVAFEEADIVDARAQPDLGGGASILIAFEAAAAEKIAKLTREKLDTTIAIMLDENRLAEPRIMEPITGGSVQISGDFPLAEADRLARLISGKDPLPDSLEGDD